LCAAARHFLTSHLGCVTHGHMCFLPSCSMWCKPPTAGPNEQPWCGFCSVQTQHSDAQSWGSLDLPSFLSERITGAHQAERRGMLLPQWAEG
jgi:hypothetical protein